MSMLITPEETKRVANSLYNQILEQIKEYNSKDVILIECSSQTMENLTRLEIFKLHVPSEIGYSSHRILRYLHLLDSNTCTDYELELAKPLAELPKAHFYKMNVRWIRGNVDERFVLSPIHKDSEESFTRGAFVFVCKENKEVPYGELRMSNLVR